MTIKKFELVIKEFEIAIKKFEMAIKEFKVTIKKFKRVLKLYNWQIHLKANQQQQHMICQANIIIFLKSIIFTLSKI